jgi:ABC-type nickel/cobalt efflux system permease component RcnA
MDMKRFLRAEWDRVAGYAFVLAGAVALVFGFIGVRSAADVIDEISYLVTGGIGAIFLLGVGATLLLSADLHDDFRKLHRVEEKLDQIHRALTERHPDLVVDVRPAQEPAPAVAAGGLLAVRRSRRLALSGTIVAAALFVIGAVVTANQASTDRMTRGVGLALSGAMLAAVVAGVMLGQLKGRLEQQTLATLGPWLADDDGTSTSRASKAAEVWVVDGLTLYHRPGCRALEGRAVSGGDRAALTAGLRPCGLCEPDAGG